MLSIKHTKFYSITVSNPNAVANSDTVQQSDSNFEPNSYTNSEWNLVRFSNRKSFADCNADDDFITVGEPFTKPKLLPVPNSNADSSRLRVRYAIPEPVGNADAILEYFTKPVWIWKPIDYELTVAVAQLLTVPDFVFYWLAKRFAGDFLDTECVADDDIIPERFSVTNVQCIGHFFSVINV